MRVILFVLGIVVVGLAPAHAGTIVVMTDRAAELGAALEVALANRRVDVARLPSPGGDLRLDRAAAAQRAALEAGADAAVWIDLEGTTDVCAVSSDGRYFRHAPIGEVSPRAFAAIATSLLDELIAPPEGTMDINVNVHVDVGPHVAPPPTVATIAPPREAPMLAAELPARYPVRHDRTIIEIGPMLSPLTAGVEAEILFPLTPHWRLGAMGAVNMIFDENVPLYVGALELRHVGNGKRRHFDLGFLGGGATAMGEPVVWTGVRLNWTWEGATRGTSFGLTPLVIFTDEVKPAAPGIFASLRWGFPL